MMRAFATVLITVAAPALAQDPEIILYDFTASYCGPCKTIKPHLNNLKRQGYPIKEIDISRNPQLAARFNVKFVPTFVLLVNGQERWRDQGTECVGDIQRVLDSARRKIASDKPAATRPKEKPLTLLERMFNRQRREPPEELEVVLGQEPEKARDSVEKGAMAASVRIRVTYDGKVQFGSGTIVHSKQGRSIVLTCAHIMDQAGKDPKVQVDVFSNGKSTTYVGKVIGHDIKSDVGVITIPTSTKLPVADVVPPTEKLTKGLKVFSIGCDNGKEPSRVPAALSGVDRYLGPNNLETNLAPEHGRSGGALFDSRGRVIGVCSAADRKGNHGLYAGNRAIFEMLKKHKMVAAVYGEQVAEKDTNKKRTTLFDSDSDSTAPAQLIGELADAPPFEDSLDTADALGEASSLGAAESLGSAEPFGFESASEDAIPFETAEETVVTIPDKIHDVTHSMTSGDVKSAIDRLGGDAEVTIVIRPRDPRKSSQIVVIPHATSNFVAMLQGEVDSQPIPTSMVRPVLEVQLEQATRRQATERHRARQARASAKSQATRPILKLHAVKSWIDREATSDIPRTLTGWTQHAK